MSGRGGESEGRGTVTPAVILRTRAIREADLVVILLTPTLGKVDGIARGARRSRRRFPGGLPVGGRGEAVLTPGRGSLTPIARMEPTADHSRLGRDLEAFAYVNYLCELSDRLLGGSTADPTSFALLCAAIDDALDPKRRSPATLRRFELGLLASLGLLPALERCSVCASDVLPDALGRVSFSSDRGGLLCLAHASGAPRVAAEIIDLARAMVASGLIDPERAELPQAPRYADAQADTRRVLRDLCRELVRSQLRSPLRSLAFFAQLPRTAPTGDSPE